MPDDATGGEATTAFLSALAFSKEVSWKQMLKNDMNWCPAHR